MKKNFYETPSAEWILLGEDDIMTTSPINDLPSGLGNDDKDDPGNLFVFD